MRRPPVTYDPIHYWRTRGETYEAKFNAPVYAAQEAALRGVLAALQFGSVLDVGCGFGRIGALVLDVNHVAEYTGLDLSPTMLASARGRIAGTFVESTLAEFESSRKWDLVIAVEFLMHVPPVDIEAAVRKLLRLSARHVVTLDWTVPLTGRTPIGAHNFRHDYAALLGDAGFGRTRRIETVPVGLQTVHHVEKGRR
jgi:SAM-dependent methyltransferase